jgi:hypothetical protein
MNSKGLLAHVDCCDPAGGAGSGCGAFDAKLEACRPIGKQTGCANVQLLPGGLERLPALPARRPPACVQRPTLIAAPVHGIGKPAGHNGAYHQDGHQSCEAEQSLHLSMVPGLERPVSVSQSQIPGAGRQRTLPCFRELFSLLRLRS